uniref:Transmembrane protein n=1 Tax=Marseillevirus LCMAC201 TaxID=2506605 RepID=A0A481YYJ4_9VIRU|nr:MAG: hypothetical protein LCMAC201_05270 [Marseillevirus LCMAC201]
MDIVQKTVGQVKSITGHPKLNMGILGTSSGLMVTSAISGFISYSKLDTPELKGTKNLLLGASLLSLISSLLLGLGVFLIYRHHEKMEAAFKGFFSFGLLVLSGSLMFISGIMYAVAAVQLATGKDSSGKKYKDVHRTSYTAAVVSTVMTLGGLGAVGISFLTAILVLRKKELHLGLPPVITQVVQTAPEYDAESILSQLRTAVGNGGGLRKR